MTEINNITAALHAEIQRTRAQHRALLLRLVHSFRTVSRIAVGEA